MPDACSYGHKTRRKCFSDKLNFWIDSNTSPYLKVWDWLWMRTASHNNSPFYWGETHFCKVWKSSPFVRKTACFTIFWKSNSNSRVLIFSILDIIHGSNLQNGIAIIAMISESYENAFAKDCCTYTKLGVRLEPKKLHSSNKNWP